MDNLWIIYGLYMDNLWILLIYPLVMTNIAIANSHRHSEFSHWKLWFSIALLIYQRVHWVFWRPFLFSFWWMFRNCSGKLVEPGQWSKLSLAPKNIWFGFELYYFQWSCTQNLGLGCLQPRPILLLVPIFIQPRTIRSASTGVFHRQLVHRPYLRRSSMQLGEFGTPTATTGEILGGSSQLVCGYSPWFERVI